jgi:hypothetical protein
MTKYCKVCNEEIHPKRVQLGYGTTCVKHSTSERYTGIIAAGSKSDFEVHIIKDPELGKKLVQMSNIYNKA